jgi:hypothetical protein
MSTVRPADRYGTGGRRRSSRWVVVALGVLVVALGVGVAYVGYQQFGDKEIEGQQVSFELVDDSTVNLTFGVTRQEPGRAAVCILRVRSKEGDETGRREVYIPPSTSGSVQLDTVIRTSRPPAVADVYGCSYDVPAYLKTD